MLAEELVPLTLMLFDGDELGNGCLQHRHIADKHISQNPSIARGPDKLGAIPIEKTTESASKEGNRETLGEAEDENTETSSAKAHEQDRLSADLITQPAPEEAG